MDLVIPSDLLHFAQALYNRGLTDAEITSQLEQRGVGENILAAILSHFKKIKQEKRRSRGFAWCAVGVILLVLGCLLTFAFTGNQAQMRIVMYGLTTLGVFTTIKGLIDILGW